MPLSILSKRIELLTQLKDYFMSNSDELQAAKLNSHYANSWFSLEQINTAIDNISATLLDAEALYKWINKYESLVEHPDNANVCVGVVMAGNIPLVGFHDFLCVFMAGFKMKIKLSSKDTVLWNHIIHVMKTWNPELMQDVEVSEVLKNCDAYIATGSNNTSRYFESYFDKYPHIIRKNRTSIAILDGNESTETLLKLSNDITEFFGLGCRNVSKLFVPEHYDFGPFLEVMKSHSDLMLHHKYKNNYDYQLSIYLLNKVPYLTNEVILMIQSKEHFAPISSVIYEYYKNDDKSTLIKSLIDNDDIQAIVGDISERNSKIVPFGQTQCPTLTDYADGVDTMEFLAGLIQK